MQLKDGDFGATVDSNERTNYADATVGILDHAADLIAPTWILAPEGGQQKRANQRRNNLSSMCMPGELEREASGGGTFIGEVWFVGQQYRDASGWQSAKEEIEPVASRDDVIHASDMQLRTRAAKGAEVVAEFAYATISQHTADRLRARPMVMIAQHRHHAITCCQAAQPTDKIAHVGSCTARDEVAGDGNEVG